MGLGDERSDQEISQ